MKTKILNLLLILSSLIGYLEWGKGNKMFLIQGEIEIISTLFQDPKTVLHPFTFFPVFGQLLIFATLFQKKPGKVLTFIGMGSIGLLLGFMFVIGLISLNFKILFSTIPFLATTMLIFYYGKKYG